MSAFPVSLNGSFEILTSSESINRLFFSIEASQVPVACSRINCAGYGIGFSGCSFVTGAANGDLI